MITVVKSKKWNEFSKENENLKATLKEVELVIHEIQVGNLDVELSNNLKESSFGEAVELLIRRIKSEESERTWFSRGISHFLEIFKNTKEAGLDKLLELSLSELVKFVKGSQGVLFVIREENSKRFLEMVACYAYDCRRNLNKRKDIDEGLVGQCVLEQEVIYLRNVPVDYISITSGLGGAPPRNILIAPLIINEVVVGVLELASFIEFSANQRAFITRITESLASLIRSGNEQRRMREILDITQLQAKELKAKEEQLTSNLETMSAMKEQLSRNEIELKQKLSDLETALVYEKSSEIAKIREDERRLLESKLDTQKKMYELIINKLKSKLKALEV